jgi:hypothetical protein
MTLEQLLGQAEALVAAARRDVDTLLPQLPWGGPAPEPLQRCLEAATQATAALQALMERFDAMRPRVEAVCTAARALERAGSRLLSAAPSLAPRTGVPGRPGASSN